MRSPAAFPSNHSVDEGDGNARPQSPGSRGQAALDSTPDGSAPPQPLSLRENDQRSIHMPEVAREFFSQGSGAFCGADAPLPPAARERLFRVSLVGRAWTREKRARSPKASERGAVKHLRLQFGTKAFSGYISAIRASGCLLVKVRLLLTRPGDLFTPLRHRCLYSGIVLVRSSVAETSVPGVAKMRDVRA